jgi:hypothetical protein
MMKHKKPSQYKKTTLRMKDNHTWSAPKGYKILMIERGVLSFNIPVKWHLAKLEPIELYNKPQPNDDCRLSVSFWRLNPAVNWGEFRLEQALFESTQGFDHEILSRTDIVPFEREDIDIIWTEHRFIDPVEKREAFSRIAMARGFNVMVLVTFDYWVDDAKKFLPAWEEAMRSLQLGRYIEDPTKGPVLH